MSAPTEFPPDKRFKAKESIPIQLPLKPVPINLGILHQGSPLEPKKIDIKFGDPVNHPPHYTDGKIEVIDFIEDKELGFHLGNAVKYIARAGKKDPAKKLEDLKKGAWYLNREIERLSKEAQK